MMTLPRSGVQSPEITEGVVHGHAASPGSRPRSCLVPRQLRRLGEPAIDRVVRGQRQRELGRWRWSGCQRRGRRLLGRRQQRVSVRRCARDRGRWRYRVPRLSDFAGGQQGFGRKQRADRRNRCCCRNPSRRKIDNRRCWHRGLGQRRRNVEHRNPWRPIRARRGHQQHRARRGKRRHRGWWSHRWHCGWWNELGQHRSRWHMFGRDSLDRRHPALHAGLGQLRPLCVEVLVEYGEQLHDHVQRQRLQRPLERKR
jgi:hypothetical protein